MEATIRPPVLYGHSKCGDLSFFAHTEVETAELEGTVYVPHLALDCSCMPRSTLSTREAYRTQAVRARTSKACGHNPFSTFPERTWRNRYHTVARAYVDDILQADKL